MLIFKNRVKKIYILHRGEPNNLMTLIRKDVFRSQGRFFYHLHILLNNHDFYDTHKGIKGSEKLRFTGFIIGKFHTPLKKILVIFNHKDTLGSLLYENKDHCSDDEACESIYGFRTNHYRITHLTVFSVSLFFIFYNIFTCIIVYWKNFSFLS